MGCRDGPKLEEYSKRVEVFRPFMEVVVPEHFRGLSLEALRKNQARLVSGYYMYSTLTTAMTAGGTDTGAALPSWGRGPVRQGSAHDALLLGSETPTGQLSQRVNSTVR